MHADKENPMEQADAGNIYTFVGLKNVTTGDTLCAIDDPITLDSMTFPDPVIQVAVEPKTKADQEKMGIALSKLAEEDPTFQVTTDEESGQTLIAGMGELQLDIIVDRMRREFKVECNQGKPQVAYRETIRKAVMDQGYTHKKQTGGSGQFAKVLMNFEPLDTTEGKTFEFENKVTGGHISGEFIGPIEAGVKEAMESGILAGFPVVGVKATVTDGQMHPVDSSEMAFKLAGSMCFKEAAPKAKPVILEPIMKVEVRTPEEYMGDVIGDLNQRRGNIQSMTDGVGVKVIDAQGAEPLFFLDYIACGKNDPALLEQVVAGVADGCVRAGSALVGGETAEMPGMYDEDEYDLAGFSVGVAEKSAIVDGSTIAEGDVLIGLPSTGVHSNGFSLVRKALFEQAGYTVDTELDELGGEKLGDVLLTPTKIYVKALSPLFKAGVVKGVAHITGGGFIENIPRMIPDGLAAEIELGTWPVLPIFDVLEKAGNIDHKEMYNIFNMGIGMVLAIDPARKDETLKLLTDNNEPAYVLGSITADTTGTQIVLK